MGLAILNVLHQHKLYYAGIKGGGIMSQNDNHLSFGTKSDEPSFAEKTEKVIEKLKPDERKEGQSIRDYIQNQGSHTGIIGAVTGVIIATVSFVADLAGTIARNLLWSQPMQDAIADRMRRTSPRETKDLEKKSVNESQNELDAIPENTVNVNKILNVYGLDGITVNNSVCLKNGDPNRILTLEEFKDVSKVEQMIVPICGNSLSTSIKAALISAAYVNKAQDNFEPVLHDIPTKRGNIHLRIDQIDQNLISISLNNEPIFKKLPRDVLSNPNYFNQIKENMRLADYLEKEAGRVLSKDYSLTNDISISVDQNQNITLKENNKVIYEGTADIERLKDIFVEHPVRDISPDTAAAALACCIIPDILNKEYDHKNLFTKEEYPEGHSHITIGQNYIYLNKPELESVYRDLGECIETLNTKSSTKSIADTFNISVEEAKQAQKLENNDTIKVSSNGEKAFLVKQNEEFALYIPEKMPDILKKRALDPFLREHPEKLPLLVEKDGKIFTAVMEDNEIYYDPAFLDQELQMVKPIEIPRLSIDEITPENFADFSKELENTYKTADECTDVGVEINLGNKNFHYVIEEFDSKEKVVTKEENLELSERMSDDKSREADEHVIEKEYEPDSEDFDIENQIDLSKYDQGPVWAEDDISL